MENEELYMNTKAQAPTDQPKIPLYQAVFAWGTFALSFIFTHFAAPYFGGVWGGIFLAAFGIFIAIYARKSGVKATISHIVILLVAELFCLTPLFSANRLVCFVAAVYSFALYLYLLSAMSGADAFGRHFVLDFLRSIFVRPFASFTRQPVSALSLFKGKGRSRNVLYAFLGLLLALPLTIVVVVLLMDSDETFKNVMSGFSEFLPNLSLSIIGEILFAIPIAMYIFGALFSVKEPAHEYFGGAPEYRFLPPVLSYFAVSPICVFYLIYVIVQIGNIADAFGKNIGYAEFARRGFFELCAISVINLGVIILLQTFSKRKENDKKPLALRIYSIIIPAFTLMIIATALTKMFMYIGEYGMTQLRIYTSWFMILLAVIFALIIVLQIKDYPIWKALFASFTVLFAALCFGNFEGNIAAYNIKAYQNGTIEKLDVDAFEELGTAAAAPAYELYRGCDDLELSEKLKNFIINESAADALRPDFAYFSVPRAMAQNAYRHFGIDNRSIKVSVYVEYDNLRGVTAEYSLGGENIGSQYTEHADGSVIQYGEKLTFIFSHKDFKNPDRLSDEKFGIYVSVTDIYGKETIASVPDDQKITAGYSLSYSKDNKAFIWEWNAEFGEEYRFVLRKSTNGGYYLYPTN